MASRRKRGIRTVSRRRRFESRLPQRDRPRGSGGVCREAAAGCARRTPHRRRARRDRDRVPALSRQALLPQQLRPHPADEATSGPVRRGAGGLETAPKILFKFGSVHTGRGYSSLYQLDLGNAAAELAALRLSDSLHVHVSALASLGRDGARKDWTAEAPELAQFGRHLTEGRWGVFDQRELRQHFAADKNREAQPALAEAVFRNDVLILAPEFHAATPTPLAFPLRVSYIV